MDESDPKKSVVFLISEIVYKFGFRFVQWDSTTKSYPYVIGFVVDLCGNRYVTVMKIDISLIRLKKEEDISSVLNEIKKVCLVRKLSVSSKSDPFPEIKV